MSKIKNRLSYANVMATIAVFAVLGGGAYAATKLPKNSVKSKQIAANAVKPADLAAGSVTTDKLAESAVTGAKVDESSFDKVPTAGTADSAATAETAATAQNATSADNAANSTLFGGKGVTQIRGLAEGESSAIAGALDTTFEVVPQFTEDVAIPTGGATVIVQASMDFLNAIADERTVTCRLKSDALVISQQYELTLTDTSNGSLAIVGFASFPNATGANDPENITLECHGSAAASVAFMRGDLAVLRVPTAP